MKFYGVQVGRKPGVYTTWSACQAQVTGFPGAKFQSFKTREEAEAFVQGQKCSPISSPQSKPRSPASRPSRDTVNIWVDGACLQHAQGGMRFGWAYLILQDSQELHRASGNDIPQDARQHRNVAGEIMAVIRALTWCQKQGIPAVTIYYDYQGLESWATGAWKANTPLTQAYAALFKELPIHITWVKVKGHSGEPYNDLVDEMAKQAAQSDENRHEEETGSVENSGGAEGKNCS